MVSKPMSTRISIVGRSAKCKGGASAVDKAAYISREKMYSEYDGKTYYPKYSEDLVHTEVLLCENAPEEYINPNTLWNAVEMSEKSSNAQLARMYKFELPNEWDKDTAITVVRDYIKRNFTDLGMCVHFAIHDSVNDEGVHNLHCHLLMTMRGIDKNGQWLPKQKKVYLTDEKGERIPLIDKKTGLQKVDKQNRKQWKCETIPTNDWNNRENAKIWREDLANTINTANEKLGYSEKFWEHRSFEEQGLDILPTIHLGPKASAMERAGINTIRGDYNRDIKEKNKIIILLKNAVAEAKAELIKVKNEIATAITGLGKKRKSEKPASEKKESILLKLRNYQKIVDEKEMQKPKTPDIRKQKHREETL